MNNVSLKTDSNKYHNVRTDLWSLIYIINTDVIINSLEFVNSTFNGESAYYKKFLNL